MDSSTKLSIAQAYQPHLLVLWEVCSPTTTHWIEHNLCRLCSAPQSREHHGTHDVGLLSHILASHCWLWCSCLHTAPKQAVWSLPHTAGTKSTEHHSRVSNIISPAGLPGNRSWRSTDEGLCHSRAAAGAPSLEVMLLFAVQCLC